MTTNNQEDKHCTSCEGTGVRSYDPTKDCTKCAGRGWFPGVDLEAIVKLIISTKGKSKGRLKSAFPSPYTNNNAMDSIMNARAYYVWRMARFNGGADVTMPVMAMMYIEGDPYKDYLNQIADEVAKKNYGTDMASAIVWGKALVVI